MEHSQKFYKVKEYYDRKMWTESMVRNAVVKGWIAEWEFKQITGKDYRK